MFFFLLAKSEEANDSTITSNGAVTVDTDNKVNWKGNAKEIEKNTCKKK